MYDGAAFTIGAMAGDVQGVVQLAAQPAAIDGDEIILEQLGEFRPLFVGGPALIAAQDKAADGGDIKPTA